MLKNSLEKLFGSKQKSAPREEEIWVNEPCKINVKKAFATIRLKNGENIVSREFIGHINFWDSSSNIINTGKMLLVSFFQGHGCTDALILVKDDRMIRGTDIMDIINIVEVDHEIDSTKKVKKIFRETT